MMRLPSATDVLQGDRARTGWILGAAAVAAVGFVFSPVVGFAAASAAAVLVASVIEPRVVGMPALAVLIPVQIFVSPGGVTFSFVDVLVLALALRLLAELPLVKRPLRGGSLLVPFVVFLAALLLAFGRSHHLGEAAIMLVRIASYILVYLLALNFVDTSRTARRVLTATFVAGAFVAIVGVSESLLGPSVTARFLASRLGEVLVRGDTPVWMISSMRAQDFVRAYGLFLNPNWCGTYLAMLLAMSLPLLLEARRDRLRTWTAWLAPIWLVAFALALSRGAIVALLCALGVFFSRRGGRWFVAPVALVVLVGVLSTAVFPHAASPAFQHLSLQNVDWEGASRRSRMAVWRDAWQVLMTSPVFGVGLKSYLRELPRVTHGAWIAHPHSTYIELLVEGGIPACLAFLWLLWVAWSRHWSAAKRMPPGVWRAVVVGAACATVVFAVHSVVDHFYGDAKVAMTFWLILGVSMRLSEVRNAGETVPDGAGSTEGRA